MITAVHQDYMENKGESVTVFNTKGDSVAIAYNAGIAYATTLRKFLPKLRELSSVKK
jgi:hypothetical protein